MLSNWKNISILIITGVPIPNATLNGLKNYNTTITNIYAENFGILPFNITFNIFPAVNASLTLNNTVLIEGNSGSVNILTPQNFSIILITVKPKNYLYINISIPNSYNITENNSYIFISGKLNVSLYYNGSSRIYNLEKIHVISIGYNKTGFLEFNINIKNYYSLKNLIEYNDVHVSKWLYLSKKLSENVPEDLASEYYLMLLLLKDDQNPVNGEFAASPSPIYLYNWLRDSSFAAIALQNSGHYYSAYKFWVWMSNASQIVPGEWYTRYNFYDGQPEKSFGIPELDSIGLFQIGVYNYFQLTHNVSFLTTILPSLNRTIQYEINQINSNKFKLLPEDLSVWENTMAYHFWTQSIDDLGLYYSSLIYQYLGINNTEIGIVENELNQSIIKYFWNGTYFYPSLIQTVLFENGTQESVLNPQSPYYDSSTILPFDLGYISPNSIYALKDVNSDVYHLNVIGGLSRFTNDNYHYNQDLYDSSGPNPPWIITTLFLAYYYDNIGNLTGALNLLQWVYNHSQNNLLPEAIDPHYGNPLPSTSPLTWSSAVYVITILNLPSQNKSKLSYVLLWVIIIVFLVLLSYVMEKRSVLKR
jgi:hypothetical protein